MAADSQEDLYRGYRWRDRGVPRVLRATPEWRFARARLAPILASAPRGPIIEVGAGTGEMLRALRALGYDVHGVDASPSQVAEAASRGAPVELLDGSRALERTADNSLSAIIALDVLEHLDLDELRRWVKLAAVKLTVGGLFVIRVPNGGGLFGGTILHGDITHQRAFTADSLRQIAELEEMALARVLPCHPVVHGLASAARSIVWRIVGGLLAFASMAESGRGDGPFTRNLLAVLVPRRRSSGARGEHCA